MSILPVWLSCSAVSIIWEIPFTFATLAWQSVAWEPVASIFLTTSMARCLLLALVKFTTTLAPRWPSKMAMAAPIPLLRVLSVIVVSRRKKNLPRGASHDGSLASQVESLKVRHGICRVCLVCAMIDSIYQWFYIYRYESGKR